MSDAPLAAPDTILVGLDGSAHSARAAAYAALLGTALDAEVVAVHAVGLLSVIDGEACPSDQVRHELADAMVRWTEPLRATSVRLRTVLEDGPPGLVLLRLAERTGAGMVVLGTRGIGSPDGVTLGSTSHHVVQHSPVPVLVVAH